MNRRNWLGALSSVFGYSSLPITKVEVLEIKPGDIALITVPVPLPQAAKANIGKQFKELTGCEKVIVQSEGMKVEILRSA